MKTHRSYSGVAHRGGGFHAASRELAAEVAVSISFNGTSHAVLMATPADLENLAVGFSLSEGIAGSMADIGAIEVVPGPLGIDVQVELDAAAAEKLEKRRRSMAGPVGCGLCGIESLEAAMRDLPPVSASIKLSASDIIEAAEAVAERQALNLKTRAVHAAGFYDPAEGLIAIREDVGRHNALDKLIGALASAQEQPSRVQSGAIVMTSRLSVELVQKAASIGCGFIIAMSAPTALAVETARRANITLAATVRDGEFELFTHSSRIVGGGLPHVA